MAASKKRVADTYLTYDNWDNEDNEDSQEDPGLFKEANEEELSKRMIRKAKRRGTGEKNEEKLSNPFASFGGFGSAKLTFGTKSSVVEPAQPVVQPLIESKANKENNFNNNFWGSVTKTEEEKKDFFSNRTTVEPQLVAFNKSTKVTSETKVTSDKEATSDSIGKEEIKKMNSDFHKELCDLNISVLNWIKKHVDENPCIDLQPVFRDYSTHMKDLETKYDVNNVKGEKTSTKPTTTTTITVFNKEEKSIFKTPDNSSKTTPVINNTTSQVSSSSTFSMLKSSTPIPTNPFGDFKPSGATLFNTQSPFTFKQATTTTTNTVPETVKEEGEEDKIPEPERKIIVESDAFYQIRCKLFFKKGNEWKELGIGMLYLKPGIDEEKIQLLIRMETTTGKVLLNVTISKETPTSRSGKNNIMVVAIPNPPVFSKPTEGDNTAPCTYLIRVKGTTEADELFKKLKK